MEVITSILAWLFWIPFFLQIAFPFLVFFIVVLAICRLVAASSRERNTSNTITEVTDGESVHIGTSRHLLYVALYGLFLILMVHCLLGGFERHVVGLRASPAAPFLMVNLVVILMQAPPASIIITSLQIRNWQKMVSMLGVYFKHMGLAALVALVMLLVVTVIAVMYYTPQLSG